MSDCHARRDSVRVYNQVWNDTLLSKWHVLVAVCHAYCAFLTVSRCKLIADLRNPNRSHLDLRETVAFLVGCDNDRVNHATFRVLNLG